MKRSTRCSPELRERGVRLVLDEQRDHASQWPAIDGHREVYGVEPTWAVLPTIPTGCV